MDQFTMQTTRHFGLKKTATKRSLDRRAGLPARRGQNSPSGNSALIINVATARMPTSCSGTYVNIKLLEVEANLLTFPKRRDAPLNMRSFARGKGVVRAHSVVERNHLGSTPRCAAGREIERLIKVATAMGEVPHVLSCASALPLAIQLFRDAVTTRRDQCIVVDGSYVGVGNCNDAILLAMARNGVRLLAGRGT